nr:MAG TPA: hypothetical protein [Caudoviricetes sp.]
MVKVNTNSNTIKVNAASAGRASNLSIGTPQSYYDGLAKEWAISDNLVQGIDYSSKYYANIAKSNADSSKANLDSVRDAAEEVIAAKDNALNDISDAKINTLESLIDEGNNQIELIKEQGSSYATKEDAKYTAGNGIDITDNIISNTQTSAEWGNITGNIENQEDLVNYVKKYSGGLEVCDIGMSLYIDETKGLRRRLNGQIVAINQNTQGFLTRLKKIVALYPSLLTTEENWQAEKEASDYGQVGKFVLNYDDVADKYHAVGYDRYIFEVSLYKTTDTINPYRTAFCIHKLKDNIEVGDIGYLFDTATGEENQNITFTVTQVEANAGTEYAFFRLGGTVSGYPDYAPPESGIESALDGTDIAANNNNSPVLQILKGPTYTKSRSGEGKNFCIPDTTIGAVCYEVPYPSSPNSFTAIPHLLTHFEFVDGGILGDSSYSIGIDNEEILTDYGLYPTQPVYHYTPSTKVLISMRLPAVVNVQGLLDLQNLGMTVEAGLPNITGAVTGDEFPNAQTVWFDGALYATNDSGRDTAVGSGYPSTVIRLDASRSSAVYGRSATVQEEAIQYPYYIQIATGQETEVNIRNDIESIVPYTLFDSKYSEAKQYNASWVLRGSTLSKSVYPTAYEAALVEYNSEVADGTTVELPSGGSYTKRGVSGGITVKLSTDETVTEYDWKLDTVAETLTVPTLNGSEDLLSDRYDDLELKASGSTYTAPANGWFWIQKLSSSTGQYLTPVIKDSNGNIKYTLTSQPTAAGYDAEILAPVSKGDVISIGYSVGGATQSFRFIYAKSNGSLYFFVASVAQNAPLANLGRIEETKVDKNSSWGFPSNRYIDLELGASGSTYTAPANGWFWIHKLSGANNQHSFILALKDGETAREYGTLEWTTISNKGNTNILKVPKGKKVQIYYNLTGETKNFRFIYAEGSY